MAVGYTGAGWSYGGQSYRPLPAAARGVTGGAAPVASAIAAAPTTTATDTTGTAAPFDFSTDPGYLAALAAEQAGSAQLDAALRAARETALVRFGDPSLAGAFGIDNLNPLTAAMAQQATTSGVSTLAQLQRQRDLAQSNIVNSLAAHGLVRSGDLGWRTGQNQQNYGVALYNAQQGVVDTLAQAARNNALQKQQLQTNTVDALTKAYQTYVSNPQFWGMAGDTTPPPPASTTPATTPAVPPPPTPPPVQTQYGYTGAGPMGGWNYPTSTPAPVSRLATPSPYRFQAARNVRAG